VLAWHTYEAGPLVMSGGYSAPSHCATSNLQGDMVCSRPLMKKQFCHDL